MKLLIKLGVHTMGHAELLKRAGFEVETTAQAHVIEAQGTIEGVVDMSTDEAKKAALSAVVASKKLWTYKTVFQFAEGAASGLMACSKLGALSAFVAKASKASKSTGDDILNAVLESKKE